MEENTHKPKTIIKRIRVKLSKPPPIQRNKTAYQFFFASFKEANGISSLSEFSTLCSVAWNALQDKSEWIAKAEADKERYETEQAAKWLISLSDLKLHKRKMNKAALHLYIHDRLPQLTNDENKKKRKIDYIMDLEKEWNEAKRSTRASYRDQIMENV